jgi:CspA family cold shock protein
MLNIKNILIISFSAILAAIATGSIFSALTFDALKVYFICAFIAGLVTLIIQSFTANTKKATSSFNTAKPAKSNKKPASIQGDYEEGTVKWFDSKKGYGFITRKMGEDIFVHFRSIQTNGYRSLQEGQAVKFIVTKGDKGPQAEDIHVI